MLVQQLPYDIDVEFSAGDTFSLRFVVDAGGAAITEVVVDSDHTLQPTVEVVGNQITVTWASSVADATMFRNYWTLGWRTGARPFQPMFGGQVIIHTPLGEGTTGEIVINNFEVSLQLGDTVIEVDISLGGIGAPGSGDMVQAVYDPRGILSDAFDLANHTGVLDGGVFT